MRLESQPALGETQPRLSPGWRSNLDRVREAGAASPGTERAGAARAGGCSLGGMSGRCCVGTSNASEQPGKGIPASSPLLVGKGGWVPPAAEGLPPRRLTDFLLHYFHKNNCPELFFSRVGSASLVVSI